MALRSGAAWSAVETWGAGTAAERLCAGIVVTASVVCRSPPHRKRSQVSRIAMVTSSSSNSEVRSMMWPKIGLDRYPVSNRETN